MKRALFLLAALAAFSFAMLSAADAASVPGVWRMTTYVVEDRVIRDPMAVGSNKVVSFEEDGTAQVTINQTVYAASWTQEGETIHLVYEDGDRADFTVEPDQLVYRTGNQVQYFTRTGALTAKQAAAVVTDARALFDQGEAERAVALLDQAAEAGNTQAMRMLGDYYADRDAAEALGWYQRGAEAGDGACMYRVGLCLEFGRGAAQDYAQAMAWYRRAAQNGEADGLYGVGCLFAHGKGVAADLSAALENWKKAAEVGSPLGMYQYGQCFQFGEGLQQDAEAALLWIGRAAEAGHGPAMNDLAVFYLTGFGAEADPDLALEWFQKAADAGDQNAMRNLGQIYHDGEIVSPDPDAAQTWWRAAGMTEEEIRRRLEE